MIEHIFSYISANYRKWEIARYGIQDVNGIFRAQKEYILSLIQIFVDCIIFGFCINYLNQLKSEDFHRESFKNYWIIVDCMFMVLQLGYIQVSQKMMKNSETMKNIFTLQYVQSQILKNIKHIYLQALENFKKKL